MRARVVSVWCAATICAFALSSSVSARPAAPALRIEKLSGSIHRIGPSFYAVRLKATVCMRSASEARNTYPREIRITHFAVSGTPRRWWPARTVIDRAPWLVPIGETWHGRACGAISVEDRSHPSTTASSHSATRAVATASRSRSRRAGAGKPARDREVRPPIRLTSAPAWEHGRRADYPTCDVSYGRGEALLAVNACGETLLLALDHGG
jgi:hypothetical protein